MISRGDIPVVSTEGVSGGAGGGVSSTDSDTLGSGGMSAFSTLAFGAVDWARILSRGEPPADGFAASGFAVPAA